nr:hypothetical protein [Paludibaculum fermentans]
MPPNPIQIDSQEERGHFGIRQHALVQKVDGRLHGRRSSNSI